MKQGGKYEKQKFDSSLKMEVKMADENWEYEKALDSVKKALDFLNKQEGAVYIFASLLVPMKFYEGTEKKITSNAWMQSRGDYEWSNLLLQALVERLITERSKNKSH